MKMILEIVVERDKSVANELKGISKGLYLSRQSMVYNALNIPLKRWKNKEKRGVADVYTEEGDEEHIGKEKQRLEEFLFSDRKDLKDRDEFKTIEKLVNERGIVMILKKIRGIPKAIKNRLKKASMDLVLGEDTLLMFFLKMGISVTWRSYKVEK